MMNDRENVLRKVRALLDKAEGTTFGPERDAFIAKADSLMLKYTIESHELQMAGAKVTEEPALRTFSVTMSDSPLRDQLVDLAHYTALHARGRVVFYGLRSPKNYKMPIEMRVVAFPSDLDYLEMLLTSLQLTLARELEPKPDPSKDDVENATTLKAAGMSWDRIVELLGYQNFTDEGKPTKDRRRVIHGWRKALKETDPELAKSLMRQNPQTYQRSYAIGFVTEVQKRFAAMRREQREAQQASGTEAGTSLVLADRSRIVDDKYKEMFPNLTSGPARANKRVSDAGYRRGVDAGRRADLSGGKRSVSPRTALGDGR